MTDVERIEALKGPGSALYGRNEPGGIINLTTKKPVEEPRLDAEAMAGGLGTYRLALEIGRLRGRRIATRLLARLAVAAVDFSDVGLTALDITRAAISADNSKYRGPTTVFRSAWFNI